MNKKQTTLLQEDTSIDKIVNQEKYERHVRRVVLHDKLSVLGGMGLMAAGGVKYALSLLTKDQSYADGALTMFGIGLGLVYGNYIGGAREEVDRDYQQMKHNDRLDKIQNREN